MLGDVLGNPERPYWAIIGGSKVSDKVELLDRLVAEADGLVIGGGMANTFLSAEGFSMGSSLVEENALGTARDLLSKARDKGIAVILPTDLVLAKTFAADAPWRVSQVDGVQPGEMALDIGPDTVRAMVQTLQSARTVLWNGPMGVFEFDAFARGTLAVARALGQLDAAVVVGGGDSVAAVSKAGVKDRMTHISTGGGATLRFLEGEDLPGIHALKLWESQASRTGE
jgi:phosphoglycerate kinase